MILSDMKLKIFALLLFALPASAQKKPLDHTVYDSWQKVDTTIISPTGKYIAYIVSPQEGDGNLSIRSRQGKTIEIPRGYRLTLTPDEQYALCLIKPFFKDTRQAKIKKKKAFEMPKDTLAVITLATGEVKKYAHVSSYKIGKKASDGFAFLSSDTALIPKKQRDKKDVGRPLIVCRFSTEDRDTFKHVANYAFDKYGKTLALMTQPKKDSSAVVVVDMKSRHVNTLKDNYRFHTQPVFNEEGTQLLYLVANDTLSSGSKHCELYTFSLPKSSKDFMSAKARRLISLSDFGNLPKGWGLNEYSTPYFSHDGKRIFAGVAQELAPKDTTLVPFETAGLDVWRWDAPELPPMMNVNLRRDQRRTNLAVYNASSNQMIPLTLSKYDQIRLLNRGNTGYALSIDQTRTVVETQWNGQNEETLSLVSLDNGSRRTIATGAFSRASASPDGKYIVWFDLREQQWMIYDVAAGHTRNLTAALGVNFWDEDDDHPLMPDPYGIAGWTKGDREVMVYDRYDIWKIPANGKGKAVCLTAGEGRKTNRVFRYENKKYDEEARFIAPSENMLLRVFDRTTKENGYAMVNAASSAVPRMLTLDGHTYSQVRRAEKADAYIYCKGNFEKPMDVYETTDRFATQEKLTAINPQQKDYNWGTAELYHWTAYDGTPLEGILYKPEDFDPNKKYPVMIYFYERRSESLYSYVAPQPSWSTVNLAFYCSRGYIVFVPDILYKKDGLPGEAAYNCICSGAESLKNQYSWIDGDNMAIQGQSWGGYQVAYLITRTNMFKAAGAGAPVSNMTSAYGGIRWESGMSRQFQYEQTQSRIGKNLWEAPDLYLRNSCLFTLPNVQTPVLIMHNDADGAVPWYQGIEMFMGLRRLGKPAWMLQYNNEAHNLRERRNRKDLSVRLQQFFDHYLKGAPCPAWMKDGIPSLRKGQYFGFEEASE